MGNTASGTLTIPSHLSDDDEWRGLSLDQLLDSEYVEEWHQRNELHTLHQLHKQKQQASQHRPSKQHASSAAASAAPTTGNVSTLIESTLSSTSTTHLHHPVRQKQQSSSQTLVHGTTLIDAISTELNDLYESTSSTSIQHKREWLLRRTYIALARHHKQQQQQQQAHTPLNAAASTPQARRQSLHQLKQIQSQHEEIRHLASGEQFAIKFALSILQRPWSDSATQLQLLPALLPVLDEVLPLIHHSQHSSLPLFESADRFLHQIYQLLLQSMLSRSTITASPSISLQHLMTSLLSVSIARASFDSILQTIYPILTATSNTASTLRALPLHCSYMLKRLSAAQGPKPVASSSSSSSRHAAAGKLLAFGSNQRSGLLGLGTTQLKASPTIIPEFDNDRIVHISAYQNHAATCDIDGMVWVWGSNESNKIAMLENKQLNKPTLLHSATLMDKRIVQTACGNEFTLLLSADGQVYSVGSGEAGKLGHGDYASKKTFTHITALKSVTIRYIAAGEGHWCAISDTGKLYVCGKNNRGQLGTGNTSNLNVPTLVEQFDDGDKTVAAPRVQHVACGWEHTLVVTDAGKLYTCGGGYDSKPVLGHGSDTSDHNRLKLVESVKDLQIAAVACGWDCSFAITADCQLFSFGDNSYGQLGQGHTNDVSTPTKVSVATTSGTEARVVSVSSGEVSTAVVTSTGQLYVCGASLKQEGAVGSSTPQLVQDFRTSIRTAACGGRVIFCITGTATTPSAAPLAGAETQSDATTAAPATAQAVNPFATSQLLAHHSLTVPTHVDTARSAYVTSLIVLAHLDRLASQQYYNTSVASSGRSQASIRDTLNAAYCISLSIQAFTTLYSLIEQYSSRLQLHGGSETASTSQQQVFAGLPAELSAADGFDPLTWQEHARISCDVCKQSPLRGIRYKCKQCADYDVCSQCSRRNLEQGTHTAAHTYTEYRRPRGLTGADDSKEDAVEQAPDAAFAEAYTLVASLRLLHANFKRLVQSGMTLEELDALQTTNDASPSSQAADVQLVSYQSPTHAFDFNQLHDYLLRCVELSNEEAANNAGETVPAVDKQKDAPPPAALATPAQPNVKRKLSVVFDQLGVSSVKEKQNTAVSAAAAQLTQSTPKLPTDLRRHLHSALSTEALEFLLTGIDLFYPTNHHRVELLSSLLDGRGSLSQHLAAPLLQRLSDDKTIASFVPRPPTFVKAAGNGSTVSYIQPMASPMSSAVESNALLSPATMHGIDGLAPVEDGYDEMDEDMSEYDEVEEMGDDPDEQLQEQLNAQYDQLAAVVEQQLGERLAAVGDGADMGLADEDAEEQLANVEVDDEDDHDDEDDDDDEHDEPSSSAEPSQQASDSQAEQHSSIDNSQEHNHSRGGSVSGNSSEIWNCAVCTMENSADAYGCSVCGSERPDFVFESHEVSSQAVNPPTSNAASSPPASSIGSEPAAMSSPMGSSYSGNERPSEREAEQKSTESQPHVTFADQAATVNNVIAASPASSLPRFDLNTPVAASTSSVASALTAAQNGVAGESKHEEPTSNGAAAAEPALKQPNGTDSHAARRASIEADQRNADARKVYEREAVTLQQLLQRLVSAVTADAQHQLREYCGTTAVTQSTADDSISITRARLQFLLSLQTHMICWATHCGERLAFYTRKPIDTQHTQQIQLNAQTAAHTLHQHAAQVIDCTIKVLQQCESCSADQLSDAIYSLNTTFIGALLPSLLSALALQSTAAGNEDSNTSKYSHLLTAMSLLTDRIQQQNATQLPLMPKLSGRQKSEPRAFEQPTASTDASVEWLTELQRIVAHLLASSVVPTPDEQPARSASEQSRHTSAEQWLNSSLLRNGRMAVTTAAHQQLQSLKQPSALKVLDVYQKQHQSHAVKAPPSVQEAVNALFAALLHHAQLHTTLHPSVQLAYTTAQRLRTHCTEVAQKLLADEQSAEQAWQTATAPVIAAATMLLDYAPALSKDGITDDRLQLVCSQAYEFVTSGGLSLDDISAASSERTSVAQQRLHLLQRSHKLLISTSSTMLEAELLRTVAAALKGRNIYDGIDGADADTLHQIRTRYLALLTLAARLLGKTDGAMEVKLAALQLFDLRLRSDDLTQELVSSSDIVEVLQQAVAASKPTNTPSSANDIQKQQQAFVRACKHTIDLLIRQLQVIDTRQAAPIEASIKHALQQMQSLLAEQSQQPEQKDHALTDAALDEAATPSAAAESSSSDGVTKALDRIVQLQPTHLGYTLNTPYSAHHSLSVNQPAAAGSAPAAAGAAGSKDVPAGAQVQVAVKSDFTLMFWIKPTASPVAASKVSSAAATVSSSLAHTQLVAVRGSQAPTSVFVPLVTYSTLDHKVKVTISTNASPETITTTNALRLGVWQHLTVVLSSSGKDVAIYVNGVLDGTVKTMSSPAKAVPVAAAQMLHVGRARSSTNMHTPDGFHGAIAYVNWCHRALTAGSIKQLAQVTAPVDDHFNPALQTALNSLATLDNVQQLLSDAAWLKTLFQALTHPSSNPTVRIQVLRLFRMILPARSPAAVDAVLFDTDADEGDEQQLISHLLQLIGSAYVPAAISSSSAGSDDAVESAVGVAGEVINLLRYLLTADSNSASSDADDAVESTSHAAEWSMNVSCTLLDALSEAQNVYTTVSSKGTELSAENVALTLRTLAVLHVLGSSLPLIRCGAQVVIRSALDVPVLLHHRKAVVIDYDAKRQSALVAMYEQPSDQLFSKLYAPSSLDPSLLIGRASQTAIPSKYHVLSLDVQWLRPVDEITVIAHTASYVEELLPLYDTLVNDAQESIETAIQATAGKTDSSGKAATDSSTSTPKSKSTALSALSVKSRQRVLCKHLVNTAIHRIIAQCSGTSEVLEQLTSARVSRITHLAASPSDLDMNVTVDYLESQQAQLQALLHTALICSSSPRLVPWSRAQSSSKDGKAAAAGAAKASEELTPEQTEKIATLAGMGIDSEFCKRALIRNNWDVALAGEWLLLNLTALEREKAAVDAAKSVAASTAAAQASAAPLTVDASNVTSYINGLPPTAADKIPDKSEEDSDDSSYAIGYFRAESHPSHMLEQASLASHSNQLVSLDQYSIGATVSEVTPAGSAVGAGANTIFVHSTAHLDTGCGYFGRSLPVVERLVPPATEQDAAPKYCLGGTKYSTVNVANVQAALRRINLNLAIAQARQIWCNLARHVLHVPDSANSLTSSHSETDPTVLVSGVEAVHLVQLSKLLQNRGQRSSPTTLYPFLPTKPTNPIFHALLTSSHASADAFKAAMMEEALRHLQLIATPDHTALANKATVWSTSDLQVLAQPRVEWACHTLRLLLEGQYDAALQPAVFQRISTALQSPSLPLREHTSKLLAYFLRTLLTSHPLNDVHLDYAAILPSNKLIAMIRRRHKVEHGHILRSTYTAAVTDLVILLRRIELAAEASKAAGSQSNAAPRLHTQHITATSIEVSWSSSRTRVGELSAVEYELEVAPAMTKSTKSDKQPNWHTAYRGTANSYVVYGLTEATSYSFQVRALPISSTDSNISSWSSAETYSTIGQQGWNTTSAYEGNAIVANNGLSLTMSTNLQRRWSTILARSGYSSGSHSWSLRLNKCTGGNVFFGVVKPEAYKQSFIGSDIMGYGIYAKEGKCFFQNHRLADNKQQYKSDTFSDGDVVTLTLDCDAGTLAIQKNTTFLGVAFDILPKGELLYPAVSLNITGDSVSFLPHHDPAKRDTSHSAASTTPEQVAAAAVEHFQWQSTHAYDFGSLLTHSGNAASKDVLLPLSQLRAVELAYSTYQQWIATTVRRVALTGGATVEVETSSEALREWDASVGQSVHTDSVHGVVLGVVAERKLTWHASTNIHPAARKGTDVTAYDAATTHPACVKRAGTDSESSARLVTTYPAICLRVEGKADPVRWTKAEWSKAAAKPSTPTEAATTLPATSIADYHKLMTDRSVFTPQVDAAIVQVSTQISDTLRCTVADVLPTDITQLQIDETQTLVGIDRHAILARYALLRCFNSFAQPLLPFADLQHAPHHAGSDWDLATGFHTQLSATATVHHGDLRALLFPEVRQSLLQSVIRRTITATKPADDAYENPPALKTIKINRIKANKVKQLVTAQPSSTLTGADSRPIVALLHSLFGQMKHAVGGWLPSEFRRHVTKIDDDGQSRPFAVQFIGEGVRDNGGPIRDVFNDVFAELQSSLLPYFQPTPNSRAGIGANQDAWDLNPATARTHLDAYRFIGQLMATAVRHDIQLDLHFPAAFYKRMLLLPLSRADLFLTDESAFKMLEHLDSCKTDAELCEQLRDTYDITNFTSPLHADTDVHELIDGEANTQLTADNARAWLRAFEHHLLHAVDPAATTLRTGFHSVLPLDVLHLYTTEGLERLICGVDDFSVDALQSITVYEGDMKADLPVVHWFWQTLREFSPDQRSLFLRFVFARTRLPARLDSLHTKFKVQKMAAGADSKDAKSPTNRGDALFPASHTCFFSIQLPSYSSAAILRQRLLYAIQNCTTMDADVKLKDTELYNVEADDMHI